jgi:hypothetical protein
VRVNVIQLLNPIQRGRGEKEKEKFEKNGFFSLRVTASIVSLEEKIIFLLGATKRTSTRATVRGGAERKSKAASWPPSTLTTNADEVKLHCGRLKITRERQIQVEDWHNNRKKKGKKILFFSLSYVWIVI